MLSEIRRYSTLLVRSRSRLGRLWIPIGSALRLIARGVFRESFHLLGKLYIEGADCTNGVCRQVDDNFVVDVIPFRMVVHGFGDESRGGHEAERLHKILELIFPVQLPRLDRP